MGLSTRAKHAVGALFVVLLVSGGCSEPTGPAVPPVAPVLPVTPVTPVTNLNWDELRALLADPFLLELPARLSDAPAGVSLRSAADAAVVAIDARDLTGLNAALDRMAAEIVACREKYSPEGDDLVFMDVIDNIRARAREWTALAS